MDEAQLLWAVGSLQRRLRTVEETRLAAAAAFAERQAVADALQARCLPGIWDPARCMPLCDPACCACGRRCSFCLLLQWRDTAKDQTFNETRMLRARQEEVQAAAGAAGGDGRGGAAQLDPNFKLPNMTLILSMLRAAGGGAGGGGRPGGGGRGGAGAAPAAGAAGAGAAGAAGGHPVRRAAITACAWLFKMCVGGGVQPHHMGFCSWQRAALAVAVPSFFCAVHGLPIRRNS